jgi:hypothetical protein
MSNQQLYSADVATCRNCGTTRPGKFLSDGVCNDDWHGRVQAPEPSDELLEEFHAAKKPNPRRNR